MSLESWKKTAEETEQRLHKQGALGIGSILATLAIGSGLTAAQFGLWDKGEKFEKAWEEGDKSALAWNTADVASNWIPLAAAGTLTKFAPKAGKIGKAVKNNKYADKIFGNMWSTGAGPSTTGGKIAGRAAQAQLVGEGASLAGLGGQALGVPGSKALQKADPGVYAMEKARKANQQLAQQSGWNMPGRNRAGQWVDSVSDSQAYDSGYPFFTSENLYEKYVQKPAKRV